MTAAILGDTPADVANALLRVATEPAHRAEVYGLLGEFCHQCRNQLNTLKLSFYLAARSGPPVDPGGWAAQEQRYREVELAFDRLQQICRPMSLTPVRVSLALLWEDALPAWCESLRQRGVALRAEPPAEPAVGEFDPTRLRAAMDALAEWRARVALAGQTVKFSWGAHGGAFVVVWSESGLSGHAPVYRSPSASEDPFVLPFVARVLAAHGGTVEIETSGRFELRMRWPLDISVQE